MKKTVEGKAQHLMVEVVQVTTQNCPTSGHVDNSPIIPKIPKQIRATNPGAYTPVCISIGPYHRGNPQLKDMDPLKKVCFNRRLLNHGDLQAQSLQVLRELMPEIKSCYSEEETHDIGEDEFLSMMLLDGCFIIELFLLAHRNEMNQIVDNMLYLSLIKSDLLRAENQLPFFVLESLYNLLHLHEHDCSLVQLAVNFFCDLLPRDHHVPPSTTKFYHLLHLFHSCIADNHTDSSQTIHNNSDELNLIPPVTKLVNPPLSFKTNHDSFCHISFEGGIVEVSPVLINNNTNCLYRNLIAFEQHFFPKVNSPITAYIMLMGCLIRSKEDLKLMRQKGVVEYTLNNQKATCYFVKLCKETIMNYNKFYNANLDQLSTEVWNFRNKVGRRFKTFKLMIGLYVTLLLCLLLLQLMVR